MIFKQFADWPKFFVISSSVSINGMLRIVDNSLPTELLPVPINPVKTIFFTTKTPSDKCMYLTWFVHVISTTETIKLGW